MSSSIFRGVALATLAVSLPLTQVSAHCLVGGRFLPATLAVDDPCVADELSLPTASWFKTGDTPPANETDISVEFSKRITETFGVSVNETWTHLRPPGGPNVTGFRNLESTFKTQFYTNPAHELVMSAGLSVEWGGTGSEALGSDKFSTLKPTYYIGKGFGDLPDQFGWVRAFAVTGQVSYSIPANSATIVVDPDTGNTSSSPNPQFINWGGTLQYSMPFLKSSVADLGLPDFLNHLMPIVEVNLQTPVANYAGTGLGTTGTVNPGVIWIGSYFQVGAEAILPINRASGTGTGGVVQLHVFLDDIFPDSIGKPLLQP